jgi:hypothetical protein
MQYYVLWLLVSTYEISLCISNTLYKYNSTKVINNLKPSERQKLNDSSKIIHRTNAINCDFY